MSGPIDISPDAFVERFGDEKASAILRTDTQDKARAAMEAAVRGGITIVEFTMTTPGVLEVIEEFAAKPGLVVGAGTVLTVEQARDAHAAGARFLVSPVTDAEVIREAGKLGVAAMPGANTPTEMYEAHRAGAQLQKLFPCPAGGPTWLRSVLGPLPMLNVVPTNGVDADNLHTWVDAGIHAAGFVATLFKPAWMAAQDWSAIEAEAKRIVAAVAALELRA